MKLFTLMDFINYNNPCFSCDNNINLYLIINDKNTGSITINPNVKGKHIEFTTNLKYKFFHNTKLSINPFTNEISNNSIKFLKYLEDKRAIFVSKCNCNTYISTNFLEFSDDNKFLKPLSIHFEILVIKEKNEVYEIENDYLEESSYIYCDNSESLNINPLPLYKYKTRKALLDKVKTYLTFS